MLTKSRTRQLHFCFALALVGTWIVGCHGGARPTPSAVRNTDDVREAVESILATPTIRPSPTLHPSRHHGQTDHDDNNHQGFFESLVTGFENVAETVYNRTAEIAHDIANETSTIVNSVTPLFSQQGVDAAANATSSLIQNYTSMTPGEMASNASSLVESGWNAVTNISIPSPNEMIPNITLPSAQDLMPNISLPYASELIPNITLPNIGDLVPNITLPSASDLIPNVTLPNMNDLKPNISLPSASDLVPNITLPSPGSVFSNISQGVRNVTSGIPMPAINANISDYVPVSVTPSPAPTHNAFERAMEYFANLTNGHNVTYRHCGSECSYYNKTLTRSCRPFVERRDDNLWCTMKNRTSGQHDIESCCGKYSDCCVPNVINISIITVLGGLVLVMLPILIAKMVHNRKQEQEALKHKRLEEDEPQHSRL